jgi:hypothetical protein
MQGQMAAVTYQARDDIPLIPRNTAGWRCAGRWLRKAAVEKVVFRWVDDGEGTYFGGGGGLGVPVVS